MIRRAVAKSGTAGAGRDAGGAGIGFGIGNGSGVDLAAWRVVRTAAPGRF